MSAATATPSAAPAAAVTTASAQGQPVAVVDASRIATAAARAVLLEAVVQGRAPDGVVTLKTPQGNVQIRATTPLPTGATVALELTRNGEQVSARLLPPAALRAPPTGAALSAPPQTSGSGTAVQTPAASPHTATPRASHVGEATFGAVALAADPASPPRPPGAGMPAPGTAGAQSAREPAGTAAAVPAARATVPGTTPTAGAAPANPSSTGAATATTPTSPPAIVVTPATARSTAASPQTASMATSPTSTATTGNPTAPPTTPAMTASDTPIATRAAVAAIYAQARPTASARTTTTTTATTQATATAQAVAGPGTRPAIDPPARSREPTNGTTGQTPPPSSAAAATPRLQPGTTIEIRLATTTPQPGSARPAQPLPATVVGAMPQGRLVVDTPLGRLAVSVPPDLLGTPPGDTLPLEWLPESARAPLTGERGAPHAPSTRAWPQARDVATTLLGHGDAAVRDAAEQLVPKPGARLAQQMMGFIGRGDGDVARWLGEAVMRQLEQLGLAELVGRLEGGTTREPDRQPANGDWRHATMPLYDGATVRPIEIRARRRNGGQSEGGRDQSRFVVDCVHDELGAVQIDGLMTAASAKKRLDVILRSHVELPEADRVALGALFADTCGAMGFGGDLAFQVLEHFPVVADNPQGHRAVIA